MRMAPIRGALILAIAISVGLAGGIFVRSQPAFACSYAFAPDPVKSAELSAVIVVARVGEVHQGQDVTLKPEAFLKGAVQPEMRLTYFDTTCDLARLTSGERVLVFFGDSETTQWPQEHS